LTLSSTHLASYHTNSAERKPILAQLAKKFLVFYEAGMFITTFSDASFCSLSSTLVSQNNKYSSPPEPDIQFLSIMSAAFLILGTMTLFAKKYAVLNLL
jgi:hypothetical protein